MHCVLFLFGSGRCYRASARCCITLLFFKYFNHHGIFTSFKPLIACESPFFLEPNNTPSNYPHRVYGVLSLPGIVGFFENCVKFIFVWP